jgi:ribosomal protein S18 acetylase RimI-like enzyme
MGDQTQKTVAPQFRPYRESDRDACLSIFRSNVPTYFHPSELVEFESFLDQPNCEYLVALVDDTVLACGGSYLRDKHGQLCWGMVDQNNHRQSIGTALLHRRLDHLFSHAGAQDVAINTSQHTSGFFARFGFRITQTITDGYGKGIDQVSMSLPACDWAPRRMKG